MTRRAGQPAHLCNQFQNGDDMIKTIIQWFEPQGMKQSRLSREHAQRKAIRKARERAAREEREANRAMRAPYPFH